MKAFVSNLIWLVMGVALGVFLADPILSWLGF